MLWQWKEGYKGRNEDNIMEEMCAPIMCMVGILRVWAKREILANVSQVFVTFIVCDYDFIF